MGCVEVERREGSEVGRKEGSEIWRREGVEVGKREGVRRILLSYGNFVVSTYPQGSNYFEVRQVLLNTPVSEVRKK